MASELGKVVGKVAPLLGNALNLVLPGSGLIVSGIAALFGANSNSEQDIIDKINADPEAALKLRTFELQNQTDLYKLSIEDRDSARKREVGVVTATGHIDRTLSILAFGFVGGFFIYAFMLFFVKIDPTAHDIVLLLAGQISSMALTVGGYYFGSMLKAHSKPNREDVVLPHPDNTK